MSVFSLRDFADHEQVVFCSDDASGLKAIIAVHNSNLGPALGGCRMWHYASEDDAIRDVLRLARGMTYKSALAGLQLGGGKSVIIGNPRTDKTPALLDAFARALNRLNGRYVAAEDSGTNVADMKYLAERTPHVAGIIDKPSHEAEGMRSGDPSPATAYGTFFGIRAAVKRKLGRDSLDGLRVAIQGVGNVGFDLARQLKDAGAQLWVADIHEENLVRAREELGARALAPEAIYAADVDVFAPCAMGAILNDETIPQLRACIVAGAANNQLAEVRHGSELMRRGILYAPDYVINAGGIIDIYHERIGFDRPALLRHLEGIHDTLLEIFERADKEARPTGEVADALAEERFKG
jgi:leucine dehydrogenase